LFKDAEFINKTRFIQGRTFSEKAVPGFDHEHYEERVTCRINPALISAGIDPEAFMKIYKREVNKALLL
jgi:hypothetical protein